MSNTKKCSSYLKEKPIDLINMDNQPTKKYFKIGEVSRMLGVNASTLRFWEKKFPQVKPMKNKKGDRIYNLKDIDILKEIQYLTHNKGVRLSHATKKVRRNPEQQDEKATLVKELRNLKEQLLKMKDQLE